MRAWEAKTAPRRVQAWLRRDRDARPYVLGHRGARRRAPENTLGSFDLAMEEGADGVELDVRLDRDGDVVVIHDDSLDRVTGKRDGRLIEDVGRAELNEVDLGNGERVPRLEDVLAWARGRGARVNVELKKDVSRRAAFVFKVARLIALEPRAADWLVLSSFDPRIVAAVSRLVPWVGAGWLVEEGTGIPGRSFVERLVGASAVHPQASLVTAAGILPWQREHLPVNVWTVNDANEARRLDALGVDTLITDVPGEILQALASR
jgi:glycerophosphoryl diester phosphodiesterase